MTRQSRGQLATEQRRREARGRWVKRRDASDSKAKQHEEAKGVKQREGQDSRKNTTNGPTLRGNYMQFSAAPPHSSSPSSPALPEGSAGEEREGGARGELQKIAYSFPLEWGLVLGVAAAISARKRPPGCNKAPTVGLEPTTTRLRALRSTG